MRVLVVINGAAGGADAGLYSFTRELGMAGVEITLRFAGPDVRLEDLVTDADEFDRVVAAGGDGTASAIAYAIPASVPMLVYPAGTANLLAQNLGMPLDARSLAEVTLAGIPVAFDLGELTLTGDDGNEATRGFVVMAGAGYDATIMEAATPLKSSLGPAAYLAAAVANLAPTVAEFELVLDGEHITTDGIAVLLVNFGRIQFDISVAQGFDPHDGMLDIAVLRTRHVAGLIPAVFAAVADRISESKIHSPGIDLYSAREVRVLAKPKLRLQYDGEVLNCHTPFSAKSLRNAATFLVPADSIYARDSSAS